MPHFMMQWQFNSASAKALVERPADRTSTAKALVEGFGGKQHAYYFCFGEFDGLGIAEFPDTSSAAACAMAATATGAFSRFETTVLLAPKEAEAVMQRAHDTKTGYRPPHG